MTTVFIDADACPTTRETITVARAHGLPVVLVGNGTQNFEKHLRRNGVEAVQVGQGRDSADFAIVERLSPGDVVVTQDIGVAAMALGRGAAALWAGAAAGWSHQHLESSATSLAPARCRRRALRGRSGG